jgi:ornithine carbamoyltransferase
MLYGCAKVGISVSVAVPRGFEPNPQVVKECKSLVDIDLTQDPQKAAKDADVVVTDTFVSIHDSPGRLRKFYPKYQVNSALMAKAKKSAIFMHCLPAKRGQEVTSSVIDGSQSVVWDEAENRLHSQKALLASLPL